MSKIRLLLAAGVALVFATTLLAYRLLPARPFAADDFQWLLQTHAVSLETLRERATTPAMSAGFFRPVVWLALWGQVRLFGLEAAPFHLVNLTLHLANALLVGVIAWRTCPRNRQVALLAAGSWAALHPAPYEAIVWVSAQSELLVALLLTLALALWPAQAGRGAWPRAALAALALALALITKESAIIGIVLLALFTRPDGRSLALLSLPAVPVLAFCWLQLTIDRGGVGPQGYGFGGQLLRNPLYTLGELAALGQVQANIAVPLGMAVLVALLAWAFWRREGAWRLLVALALALAPTAPFAQVPDSRYMYLPLLASAVIIGWWAAGLAAAPWRRSGVALAGALAVWLLVAGRLSAGQEARFAAANGSGGSLWELARATCQQRPIDRFIIVDAPLAAPHAEAIVRLACDESVTPIATVAEFADDLLEPQSVVVTFPGGRATISQQT